MPPGSKCEPCAALRNRLTIGWDPWAGYVAHQHPAPSRENQP